MPEDSHADGRKLWKFSHFKNQFLTSNVSIKMCFKHLKKRPMKAKLVWAIKIFNFNGNIPRKTI